MKTPSFYIFAVSSLGFCCAATSSLQAQVSIASDDASQAAYQDGWTTGDNGGTGFTAWDLSHNNNDSTNIFAGYFIGDSTTGAGNVNTSGQSFAIYANPSTAFADASRSFSTALTAGDTFSLDIAVNFRNGNKGLDLISSAKTVFTLNIGSNAYTVTNAETNNGDLFNNDYNSNTVFSVSFTQSDANGGTWTVTRSGGLNGTVSGAYTGDATGFKLYNSNTDNGNDANNLYFNNLAITQQTVPEPSSTVLLGLGVAAAGVVAMRRRHGISTL